MNYILLGERTIKAARKQHRCIWCGQDILVGDPYTYERSIFEGDPQSNHWHPECLGRMRELMAENDGEYEFNGFYEERPAVGKSDEVGK